MADYRLKVSSYAGLAPGARHYRGRVQGDFPASCHRGLIFGGGITCSEGHPLPDRVEWDVEAAWTEEQNERWAAGHFEGDGSAQFLTLQAVKDAAVARFTGAAPVQWWEGQVTPGQPGDRLYYGLVPEDLDPSDGPDPDGYGELLCEIKQEEPAT